MPVALVSGGAGFIGSHLCKRLLEENYRVLCIDNLVSGSQTNIDHLLALSSHFQFVKHDLSHPLPQSVLEEPFDAVFHLASPASPNRRSPRSYMNHPIETLLVNSLGTYFLLELSKSKNTTFLLASSSEVYGDPLVSPQSESYFGNVNPNGARCMYDEGKRFAEALITSYVKTCGVNGRIVRIFNTYGPSMQKDDGRVISNFITQALAGSPITVYGDGSQSRSFCYIDDMVEGILRAMNASYTKGEVINLGNPDEKTILEVAKKIRKQTSSSSQIVFEELPQDDPKTRNPDIQKAKNLLQWTPKVSFEEGLEKTIAYFKNL